MTRDIRKLSAEVGALCRSIPGFAAFESVWADRAPLVWDASNPEPVAKMICVLLSDWAPATTGEIVHVDGGFHAIAAAGGPTQT